MNKLTSQHKLLLDISLNSKLSSKVINQISAQQDIILSQKLNLPSHENIIRDPDINAKLSGYTMNYQQIEVDDLNILISENNNLKNILNQYKEKFLLLNEKLQKIETTNQNLLQDFKLHKIHLNNLKMINMKLTNTIKNLQSYRKYVMQLILKKNRASSKIKKLIIAIKNMQAIIRNKNAVIKKLNYNNNKLYLQVQKLMHNNCLHI